MTSVTDSTSARLWLELALVPKVSISAKIIWLREFGSPGAVLEQPVAELKRLSDEARPLAGQVDASLIDGILDWSSKVGGSCIFLGDDEYPQILYERLADAPLALFARGDLALLDDGIVAMAGTPAPSQRGAERAKTMALELAQEGVVVAGGISPGIASSAIRGAMAGGGKVAGVIGTQSSWQGVRMTEDLAASGLLVSEFAPNTADSGLGYAKRHRLLPALANLLVVVEAPVDCDSLRLAGDAADMGCEVATVPNDPSNDKGRGCNNLLRDGAALVESSADVLALASTT